ncbi:hypothetical protein QF034_000224 [Streptomyces africanus]|uniref:Uncharacterized protein n=1 Tax=Streptomyces africanus TaxID=231024 RepID=A0ABU0QF41_9ACTN|nr:hypothetical protein [Streptomyces africanus]MDQ0745993.1 hypothetical protein [Streptomyces africanus]
MPCTVGSLIEFGHLQGQVRLPTGQLVVCGCVAIRGGDGSSDWLAAIGTETCKTAAFSLGVIGFEVSGCTDASTLAGKLPQTRNVGYLLPQGDVLHHGAANT